MDEADWLVRPGEVLLPRRDLDWRLWACVACDQFTAQPRYWEEVAALVGDRPSAFKLILPECYLAEAQKRIPKVHDEMRRCLDQKILEVGVKNGFILTVRSTNSGQRAGLIALMDLEGYDYRPGTAPPIRPTEGTIEARIPPRVKVRQNAALDMSHVLMLLDDARASVIEPLFNRRMELDKLYDFSLMMGGGHTAGFGVTSSGDKAGVMDALRRLASECNGQNPLIYAVGDGNHSLAAAKSWWETLRPTLTPKQRLNHPARFILVELVNIHDEALHFEPIHRLVTGCDEYALLTEWDAYAAAAGIEPGLGAKSAAILRVLAGRDTVVNPSGSTHIQTIAALQAFLNIWVAAHPEAKLDYIHGEAALREMASVKGAAGFLMPALEKDALFTVVNEEGVLPRKAFSLGEAHEKRYYLETRRLE
ncbi:MAG: DUF1015 domain-containing protein [Clostridia bacterium]|nr:DUF1015 domain-containing protein [Clostridia bacterium]